MSSGEIVSLVWLLLALAVVTGGFWMGRRVGLGPHWLRNALIWICVIVGLALVYMAVWPMLPTGFGLR